MAEPTFQQLTEQVQRLTQRVAALEHELGMRVEVPAPAPAPPPPPVKAPLRAPDLESKVGLRWVNRVGAITFILGVAFFFSYAVENNWIGETARVLLGLFTGMALLAGGEFGFRRGQLVFAQGITGSGAAILYLSCYAAFNIYSLIAFPVAFVSLACVIAASAALAVRYQSQAIAILALLGGLLAPTLLQKEQLSPWFLPVYLAVLDAAFLFVTQRFRWKRCEWIALAGTALYTVNMADTPLRVLLPVYYLLFATRPDRLIFAAAHIAFLGRASFLPERLPVYAPNLLGMSLAGLVILRWRKWLNLTSLLVSAAGISWALAATHLPLTGALLTATALFALFLTSSDTLAMPVNAIVYFAICYARLSGWGDSWRDPRAALLALALAGLYFTFAILRQGLAQMVSGGIAVAFLTLAIPIELSAFRITVAWALEGAALVWIGVKKRLLISRNIGLVVLSGAVLHFFGSDVFASTRLPTALGVAAALFFAAFWIPLGLSAIVGHIVLLTAIAFEVVHRAGGTNAASATVSILFAAYAVLLVAIGTATRTAANRYVGLVLIALVVVKLYLYDVWQLDTVYRFIAFAALGALLLAISFLYSRFRDRIASWLTLPGVSEVHPLLPPE